MIKVLFLINTLGGGGAERVLVNLVNNMDRSRFDITVETMFDDGVNRARLSEDIRYISKKAPCFRGIAKLFCLIPARSLYRYFIGDERYDVLVAFMHGAPTKVISGCPDPSVKKLTWLHTGDPAHSTFFDFWFRRKTAFQAYASCDAVVGIADTVANAFSAYTGIRDNMRVVYNTNDTELIARRSKEEAALPFEKTRPLVCSVGRAVREKGFDRLIAVSKKLHDEGICFDLAIVGDGECMSALREQVSALQADEYVHLLGFRDNPYPVMAASDLFVCSSRQEGLSTVVSEALILGMPVVSTDVSGAKEMLGDQNEYGLVVENSEQGVYDGLKAMLTDENRLSHYRCQAQRRAPFFSAANTVSQAEELIEEVLAGKVSDEKESK